MTRYGRSDEPLELVVDDELLPSSHEKDASFDEFNRASLRDVSSM